MASCPILPIEYSLVCFLPFDLCWHAVVVVSWRVAVFGIGNGVGLGFGRGRGPSIARDQVHASMVRWLGHKKKTKKEKGKKKKVERNLTKHFLANTRPFFMGFISF